MTTPVGVRRGAGADVVRDMIEMIAAQNTGIYDADHAVAIPTPTSFCEWCEQVLCPAVAAIPVP